MDNTSPGFVERLVPDAGGESVYGEVRRSATNDGGSFFVDALAMFGLDQIHFMDEAENMGIRAEFSECLDYRVICIEVTVDFAGFDVEDVDQDCDV